MKAGQTVLQESFTHDRNGQVLTASSSGGPQAALTFVYDVLGRLSSSTQTQGGPGGSGGSRPVVTIMHDGFGDGPARSLFSG